MQLNITGQLDRAAAEHSVRRDVRAWIARALELAPQVFRRLQSEPKSGAPGPVHQRSAAGEVPAAQFGKLGGEIETEQSDDLHGEVHWTVHYASYLEEGTSNLAPRPFLEQTAEDLLVETRQGELLAETRQGELLGRAKA